MSINSDSVEPLSYTGIDLYEQPPFKTANRPPTINDQELPGTVWQDNSSSPPVQYITKGAGLWAVLTPGSGSVTSISSDSGTANPSLGVISFVGGLDIATSASGNEITIDYNGTPGGLGWNAISASQVLVPNNGHVVTGGTPALSLPALSALGDQIIIILDGGTSWTITQGIGQRIRVGNVVSTSGVSGSVNSESAGDSITMTCTTANTAWTATSVQGNLLII